jgi:uncharacterized protein YmfQ (DUF2313 family)
MATNLDRYISLFYNLLPKGKAWVRRDSSNLFKLIKGYCPEFTRVEERISSLQRESNPREASETLEDWEKLFGLPDYCTKNLNLTIEQRRNIVIQKLASGGGSSVVFFQGLLELFGYPNVKIIEYKPFRSGKSQCGSQISNELWRFVFKVFSEEVLIQNFQSGRSQSGDQIRTFGDPALECIIKKIKPAHTKVLFSYGEL